MKKILAGVLAAASMLAVSATAFAADDTKNVTKPGEVEYEVAVAAPTITLNLVMPAKMSAALNPYGAEIKLDAAGTATANWKIGSVGYKVENKTKDYGVVIDAKAVTTISTTDKPNADKTPAWGVIDTAITDKQGVKNAQLVLQGAKDLDTLKAIDKPAVKNKSASDEDTQGVLVLNSTVEADKEKGVAAGETSVDQLLFVAAEGEAYMGFIGQLGSTKPASGNDPAVKVVWNEDDAINVQLVLKVTAGAKTLKP